LLQSRHHSESCVVFEEESPSSDSWMLAEQHDQFLSNQAQLNGLGRMDVLLILSDCAASGQQQALLQATSAMMELMESWIALPVSELLLLFNEQIEVLRERKQKQASRLF
jgi:hypothetical protein